jgi:hypothetical protein
VSDHAQDILTVLLWDLKLVSSIRKLVISARLSQYQFVKSISQTYVFDDSFKSLIIEAACKPGMGMDWMIEIAAIAVANLRCKDSLARDSRQGKRSNLNV